MVNNCKILCVAVCVISESMTYSDEMKFQGHSVRTGADGRIPETLTQLEIALESE